jgi:hypothetical protein
MITTPKPFYYVTFTDRDGKLRIGRTYTRKVNAKKEAVNLLHLGYADVTVKKH